MSAARTAIERSLARIATRYKMPLHPKYAKESDIPVVPENEAWQDASLQNSWVNYGAGHQDVQYMKDANGFVHIRGVMKDGTAAAGTLIFTLPAGYRPPAQLIIPTIAEAAIESVDILADGSVKIKDNSSSVYYSLGHFCFSTEE